MTNKMTKKMALEIAIKALDAETNGEAIDKLKSMIVQLDKKSGAEKKPTATQVANEDYKTAIIEFLKESGKSFTISELIKEVAEIGELTNQRVSALVRQLVAENIVTRTEEKRKAYFSFTEE